MTSIVAQRAAKETTSLSACFTSEVMPRTVAMAPGPNMIGMATGRKATSSPTSAEWPVPRIMDVSEDGGEKRSKPMRLRMMPPTMRTMLSATAKIRRMSVPRRRGKHPEPGIDAGWTGRLDGAAVHPGLPEVQKDRQSFQGIDDRQECGEHADEVRERLLQAPTPFSRTVPVLLTRQGRACPPRTTAPRSNSGSSSLRSSSATPGNVQRAGASATGSSGVWLATLRPCRVR